MASQKTKDTSSEIRKQVSEQIVALMESDGLMWVKGFDGSMFMAQNPISPTRYSGTNRAWLALIQKGRHITDPRWATFLQVKEKGWRIKRGAHAAKVECWKPVPCVLENNRRKYLKKDEVALYNPEDVFWPLCLVNIASVFSYADIDGPSDYVPAPLPLGFEFADALIATSRCPVYEAAITAACYRPGPDEIVMPPRGAYDSPAEYTSTLLHEMAHSTIVPLARKTPDSFRDCAYAYEELCAELASVFAEAELGLPLGRARLENHAAYLQSWVECCKSDSDAMNSALTCAQGIADYLVANVNVNANVNVDVA